MIGEREARDREIERDRYIERERGDR